MDEPADDLLDAMSADPRSGVRGLAERERRRRKSIRAECARLENMLQIERRLRVQGLSCIAGVDEAGRGPLAGPVVAAAVILSERPDLPGLNDSKALSATRRERLFDQIRDQALAVGTGQSSPAEIDTLNILQATHQAMRRAIEGLHIKPDRILVDGNSLPGSPYPEMAVVGGDAASLSIAAASVIAKVTRDRIMVEYDRKFPGYGFARHKGYGSETPWVRRRC